MSISSKYTSHITLYYRNSKVNYDVSYVIADEYLKSLKELFKKLFKCIFKLSEIAMVVKWKQSSGKYICHKRDPGVAHLNKDGRIDFEIKILQSTERQNFNSFEYIISGDEMRLLLYKDGHYAHKGISPNTPLDYFDIDKKELLIITRKIIELCNPGEQIVTQNELDNYNSQINNSGCVYYIEKYFLERDILED